MTHPEKGVERVLALVCRFVLMLLVAAGCANGCGCPQPSKGLTDSRKERRDAARDHAVLADAGRPERRVDVGPDWGAMSDLNLAMCVAVDGWHLGDLGEPAVHLAEVWRLKVPGAVTSIVVGGGLLLVGIYQYGVLGVSEAGRLMWTYPAGAPALKRGFAPDLVALKDGVYFGAYPGSVFKISYMGSELWSATRSNGNIMSIIQAKGDGVVVATERRELLRVDGLGRIVRSTKVPGEVTGIAGLVGDAGGNSYVILAKSNRLVSYDEGLNIRWQTRLDSEFLSPHVTALTDDGRILLGSSKRSGSRQQTTKIAAHDRSCGRQVWEHHFAGEPTHLGIIGDGLIYLDLFDQQAYKGRTILLDRHGDQVGEFAHPTSLGGASAVLRARSSVTENRVRFAFLGGSGVDGKGIATLAGYSLIDGAKLWSLEAALPQTSVHHLRLLNTGLLIAVVRTPNDGYFLVAYRTNTKPARGPWTDPRGGLAGTGILGSPE